MTRPFERAGLTSKCAACLAFLCIFVVCQTLILAVSHKAGKARLQGRIARYSPLRLDLTYSSSEGSKTRSFLIAKTAVIVDDVHPGDFVNVVYEDRGAQSILILLQRVPEIDFDSSGHGTTESPHYAVSEVILPESESSRLMAMVGDNIDPRTPEWVRESQLAGTGGGGGGGEQPKGDSGIVFDIERISPVETKLIVNIRDSSGTPHVTAYILDLTTTTVGRISKGAFVRIFSTRENDHLYAVDVRVEGGRR